MDHAACSAALNAFRPFDTRIGELTKAIAVLNTSFVKAAGLSKTLAAHELTLNAPAPVEQGTGTNRERARPGARPYRENQYATFTISVLSDGARTSERRSLPGLKRPLSA